MLDQSVPGHYELGLYDSQMIENESGELFLLGGQDGFKSYNDIYAYNEWFGFYDIGKELPKKLFDFVAIDISIAIPELNTANTTTEATTRLLNSSSATTVLDPTTVS